MRNRFRKRSPVPTRACAIREGDYFLNKRRCFYSRFSLPRKSYSVPVWVKEEATTLVTLSKRSPSVFKLFFFFYFLARLLLDLKIILLPLSFLLLLLLLTCR